MISQPSATNDMAIHIVERAMHVNELIMIMYNSPSPTVYDHFKIVNSHLKNHRVEVGQVVLLSPPNSMECTREELIFLDVAHKVDQNLKKLGRQERILLAQRFDLLSNVANYNGMFLGMANTAWTAQVKQVEVLLKEIERAYARSYNKTGDLSNAKFFAERKVLFQRLDVALSRFGHPVMSGGLVKGDVRRNLGLSTKSIAHQWKQNGGHAEKIPDFAKHHKVAAQMSQNLSRVGYIGMGLSVANAEVNIRKACLAGDSEECTKSKYTERGAAVVSIGGGVLGGLGATYITCTLAFGVPSGGSSALWCAIVAGGVGGIAGGTIGAKAGGIAGEELYKYKRPL